MTVHFLVEGPSERAFLERWARRLIKDDDVRIHPHEGKGTLPRDLDAKPDPKRRGLLDQLPAKLRGFAAAFETTKHLVVVLLDADNDDAGLLRDTVVHAAKSIAADLPVLVTLAVEETEAFYLGDLHALETGYPHADMKRAREYVPDSIVGTWELFGDIVGDGGGNKVSWGETMGALLTIKPEASRSPSFKYFLQEVMARRPQHRSNASDPPRRRYRHGARRRRRKQGRR